MLDYSCFTDLPYPLSEVVELRDVYGYTFHEISKIMQCPESTIKARYYKGINWLRKNLMDEVTIPPKKH